MDEAVKPIYVLYGDDLFLRDLHRQEIVRSAIGDADAQMCVSSFDADAELAAVLDEIRTLPFLGPRRVVLVRDADAFVSANRQALEEYLKSPCPSGTLVLMVSSWPSKPRLYKIVAKVGRAIDCSAPPRRDLLPRLEKAAARHGKKLARAAAELLVEWIGPDLAALNSEIDKLTTYVGSRGEVTAADVSAVVTASAGVGDYDLTNAITRADIPRALAALDGMLTVRGAEFKTLGMLAWHLRRAAAAQEALQAGRRGDQALPKMPYDQAGPFLAMLKRRPLRALHRDFRRLIAADLAMKSGAEPKAAMQELVVGLCSE